MRHTDAPSEKWAAPGSLHRQRDMTPHHPCKVFAPCYLPVYGNRQRTAGGVSRSKVSALLYLPPRMTEWSTNNHRRGRTDMAQERKVGRQRDPHRGQSREATHPQQAEIIDHRRLTAIQLKYVSAGELIDEEQAILLSGWTLRELRTRPVAYVVVAGGKALFCRTHMLALVALQSRERTRDAGPERSVQVEAETDLKTTPANTESSRGVAHEDAPGSLTSVDPRPDPYPGSAKPLDDSAQGAT